MSKRSKLVKEWAEAGAVVSIGLTIAGIGLLFRFRWFFLAASVAFFILGSVT
jgi:hypothetical protein